MVNALLVRRPLRAWQAILLGGIAVGTLDIVDAIVFWHLRAAVPPSRIFQSIAAGLYGRPAFEGGMQTAIVGGVLHYFIATSMVTAYLMLARRVPMLTRRPSCAARRTVWGYSDS